MRSIALALTTLLAGCYDFTGDRGRIGFSTDATLDGVSPWTPGFALAVGARPTVAATEIVATGDLPADVRVETSSALQARAADDGHMLSGWDGWIGFDAAGVRDGFDVRWREAYALRILAPDGERADAVIGIVAGEPTRVRAELVDRSGRPLGWVPEQLEVSIDGALSASTEHGLTIDAEGPGRSALRLTWPDGPTASLHVIAFDPAQVAWHPDGDGGCTGIAWLDGDAWTVWAGVQTACEPEPDAGALDPR